MWQSNVNFDVTNKVKQEGLDGTIISTMKIMEETLHKVPPTQKYATEVHHVKVVHSVLVALEEQSIALLFGHGNVNVALNKTRMIGHTCQMQEDLTSTCLIQKRLVEISLTKICPTHCQHLVWDLDIAFPLIIGVIRQVMCPFTLIVGLNHGVRRRHIDTATHAIASDATQEIKNISLGYQLCQFGETT